LAYLLIRQSTVLERFRLFCTFLFLSFRPISVINAKKHSLSHQLTAQLRIENSKNKKNGDKTFASVDI